VNDQVHSLDRLIQSGRIRDITDESFDRQSAKPSQAARGAYQASDSHGFRGTGGGRAASDKTRGSCDENALSRFFIFSHCFSILKIADNRKPNHKPHSPK